MTYDYESLGYAVQRSAATPEVVDFLALYLAMRSRSGHLNEDLQVAGAASAYGEPAFEALLASLVPLMSTVTGCAVVPTYSFVRVYRRGQELAPHSDRPACEHSMTIHLASSDRGEWPLHVRGLDGAVGSVVLFPGDAVAYRGCDLEHWREPCPVDWYAQAFLHFVDVHGPHASHVFDRRAYLGFPRVPEVS